VLSGAIHTPSTNACFHEQHIELPSYWHPLQKFISPAALLYFATGYCSPQALKSAVATPCTLKRLQRYIRELVCIYDIITDLISAGLDELESKMPYVEGDRVIEEDEFGDPIYEDAGPSAFRSGPPL
jgi:hypothetical protein